MDRNEYVHKRKGRYMAQLLELFEEEIEPRIPKDVAEKFKAQARRKFNGLATDVCDLFDLGDDAMNGHARDIKDRMSPESPASPRREEART